MCGISLPLMPSRRRCKTQAKGWCVRPFFIAVPMMQEVVSALRSWRRYSLYDAARRTDMRPSTRLKGAIVLPEKANTVTKECTWELLLPVNPPTSTAGQSMSSQWHKLLALATDERSSISHTWLQYIRRRCGEPRYQRVEQSLKKMVGRMHPCGGVGTTTVDARTPYPSYGIHVCSFSHHWGANG